MLQLAEAMHHNRTITILGLQANADINDGVITKFMQIIGWHPTLKQITLDATNVCVMEMHNKCSAIAS